MTLRVATTGNSAVAYAIKQINPHVCAAYPITPTTQIMQEVAQYIADGLMDTVLVPAESEHSALSACIGASAAGARVMTATSSAGLALMWEVLYVAAGTRLPIVLCCGNRALSAPLNIHCDHSDSMGARDSGWIQIHSENAQEAYHNLIQAVRIAEHPDVRLPVMICMDGFLLTHTSENVELLPDEAVCEFVGPYVPFYPLLDTDHPVTYGPNDLPDYYTEHKGQQVVAMENAARVIVEIGREFGEKFGTEYGLVEEYRLEDADVAIVVLGSTAGTVKEMVDQLREQGQRAGVLKPRAFRPFPATEIVRALAHVKAVAVLDRSVSFGAQGGPLFAEVRTALYDLNGSGPKVINKIFGLGGREITDSQLRDIFAELYEIAEIGRTVGPVVELVGLRETVHETSNVERQTSWTVPV